MPRRSVTPGLAALVALFLAAPASAATFTVTSGADAGGGSLRQAIVDAAANPGPDEIRFSGPLLVVVDPATPLPVVDGPVYIDGAGSVIRSSSLQLGAGDVIVSRLGVEKPGRIESASPGAPGGLVLRRLSDGVLRLRGTVPAAGAVELFGAGGANFLQRFDGVAAGTFEVGVSPEPPAGQALTATLTSGGRTSAFATDFASSDTVSPLLSSGRTGDTDGDGLADVIRLAATERLADASGFGGLAFAGVPFVSGVRTGATPDDAEFELALGIPLAGDAAPEVRVTQNSTLADPSGNQLLNGSSVRVADDVAPRPNSAVALSRTTVRLRFSEPVTTAVRATDLSLTMGSSKRTISAVRLAADRRSLEVDATPSWGYATAGEIDLDLALADAVGNRSGAAHPAVRVWASPGDTEPPKLRSVALDRKVLCARGVSSNCRRSGGTISFTLDEAATIAVDVRRARSRARSSLRIARNPGRGAVSFGDRVEGRRLRPGPYVIDVFAIDAAGNESAPVVIRVRVRR